MGGARKSAAAWLAEVKRHEREGDLFRAYDLAMQGLGRHPRDVALKHRAVVCLASTRATGQASELFTRLGLGSQEAIPPELRLEVACLEARLRKDTALASQGPARRRGLTEAAALYDACYRREAALANPEAYYPGVNAATLWLLAGRREVAATIARAVLKSLERAERDGGYFELVSAAEAHLVLGESERARGLMQRARREISGTADADYRGLASTVRQLTLVVDANRLDPALLAALAPPRVLHYTGHIIAPPGTPGRFPADQETRVRGEIEAMLDAGDFGFAYGSLAAGADILFAEAVLARGASLHVVLPFDRREFIAESVRRSGRGWVQRFRACLNGATSVRYATRDRYLGDDQLFTYCSQMAMGLALLRARFLATEAEQIAVWDGRGPGGLAGAAVDIANWRRSGRRTSRIDSGTTLRAAPVLHPGRAQRRTRAMLFGDMHGFSRLTDSQLPKFVEIVLGTFAAVVGRYRGELLLSNTWGDGLFLVFDDAGKAAGCALDLQEALAATDLTAHGLPATMGLRIGGHLGPVYTARDPVLRRDNFFGAHVSRAARIEPVTPERCVYVTETLAAVLALHNADAFECEYVGMTKAAKHYGRMRMFLLRRAAG
ncbi:MAG: adenylate/guanylate cyclase domain-containing protein [Alphaproteobacteria bacterium]|nr:adenylate/guanylate cyclase domain-containing protein [Alphaproteobacteria bacterium]